MSSPCVKRYRVFFSQQEDGALFTETRPDPPEKLYDLIIEVFDSALVLPDNVECLL